MQLTIKKLTKEEISQLGINTWPVWEKEVSVFDWTYDEQEQFYVLEGEVVITTSEGKFEVKPGDFVECAKGLHCNWNISKAIRKHYNFL